MWPIFALTNSVSMSFSNLFTKLSSGKIELLFGVLIARASAAFFIFLFFLFSGRIFEGTKKGATFAFLVGLMAAIGFASLFKMFALGAPLVTGGILAIMGVIVFTALWGVIFLGEKLTLPVFFGFLLALLSTYLLTLK